MLKRLLFIGHVAYAIAMVVLGVAIGAIYGWQQHGLIGAIALGFVGPCTGALLATSPTALLHFIR